MFKDNEEFTIEDETGKRFTGTLHSSDSIPTKTALILSHNAVLWSSLSMFLAVVSGFSLVFAKELWHYVIILITAGIMLFAVYQAHITKQKLWKEIGLVKQETILRKKDDNIMKEQPKNQEKPKTQPKPSYKEFEVVE